MRDKDFTKLQLIKAVGTVLAREGFRGLGVNSVAKEAGVNKVLIYRYFGGMPELLVAFGKSRDFWPSFDELTGGDIEKLKQLPLSISISIVMQNFINAIRSRPLTLEILAWETSDRNELTQILEEIREEVSLSIFKELGDKLENVEANVAAITALLSAALIYLAIRSRTTQKFNTIDISSDMGWKQLEHAVTVMCERCFATS